MTTADQTPAQLPRVGEGGSTVGDGETPARPTACSTCKGEWADVCSNAFHLYEAAAPADELVIETVTPANLEATARATGGGYRSPDIELPDVAPAPDGNAGGAGVEAYREAARRMHEVWGYVETMSPGEFELVAREYARQPGFRAAIDAARAPLVAEVERLTREVAEYELNIEDLNTKSVREIRRLGRDLAEAIRERDEIRDGYRTAERASTAMLAARAQERTEALRQATDATARAVKAESERDEARAEGDRLQCGLGEILTHLTDIDHPAYQAYLRWLRREPAGDEAQAKTDGGEWTNRYYGDAGQADRNVSWSTVRRPEYTHRRRVWVGPVEPVTDDGGANGE